MKKFLTSFDLKIIGIIFMLIDHIYSYIGITHHFPLWIPLMCRFVAPLFVFLLVEGFHHTRNRKKYFTRLFISGLIMYVINITYNLVSHKNLTDPFTHQFDIFRLLEGNNILMTLALLLLMMIIIDKIRFNNLSKGNLLLHICYLILLIPFILFSEGSFYELIIALIFYFGYKNYKFITTYIVTFSVLIFCHALFNYFTIPGIGSLYQVLTFDNEYMIFTVLPFTYMYNGKLGGNGKVWERNLFYYFYPLHLVILYILSDILR